MLTEQSRAEGTAEPVMIEDVGLELIPISAGTFTMGSSYDEKDWEDNEGPQTEVTLRSLLQETISIPLQRR